MSALAGGADAAYVFEEKLTLEHLKVRTDYKLLAKHKKEKMLVFTARPQKSKSKTIEWKNSGILPVGFRKLPDILFVQVSGLYGIPYSSCPSKSSTQM